MRRIVEKLVNMIKDLPKHRYIFIAGALFAIICFWIINIVAVPFSKPEYCGSCHEMEDVYTGWKTSIHYANPSGTVTECIDCHAPSKDKFFSHFASKAYYGAKDIYKHYFGGQYDVQKNRQKVLAHMPNERCLNCHASLMSKPVSPPASRIAHEVYFNPSEDGNVPSCMACHYGPGLFHWRKEPQEKK